jgi:uncharacterized membrane protein
MSRQYLVLKFFHILIAILALGTSAGLGISLEFYGSHPTHGPFLLRAIARLVAFFVLPGYVLMLVTGLWMMRLGWPVTTKWIQVAMALWAVGIPGWCRSSREASIASGMTTTVPPATAHR